MKDVNERIAESESGSVLRGTVCRKAARTGLWGSGKATTRSTRKSTKERLKR
ncbi:MAG: hypothetical protein K9H65_06840 [Bacteroidales bacterium]|nr:hypothetical protein [Bacteroidales bacterium]